MFVTEHKLSCVSLTGIQVMKQLSLRVIAPLQNARLLRDRDKTNLGGGKSAGDLQQNLRAYRFTIVLEFH